MYGKHFRTSGLFEVLDVGAGVPLKVRERMDVLQVDHGVGLRMRKTVYIMLSSPSARSKCPKRVFPLRPLIYPASHPQVIQELRR
jgi:hypothetical protein